ncbi:hypothetical protein QR680_011216 [Steinernema hermaphroditum]|uniref:RRM domain-containing protein n=1 Tax=Steinernema hermaphroditum TaxID=289476 RepID=A0AA39MBX0_9BILA|nr:hypothetical protein QR680_011216 [Steinernema hermaphroditum]
MQSTCDRKILAYRYKFDILDQFDSDSMSFNVVYYDMPGNVKATHFEYETKRKIVYLADVIRRVFKDRCNPINDREHWALVSEGNSTEPLDNPKQFSIFRCRPDTTYFIELHAQKVFDLPELSQKVQDNASERTSESDTLDSNTEPLATLGTLYVYNLHPDIREVQLIQKFSVFGPLVSMSICHDKRTCRSLGYGYVKFIHHDDAQRAFDALNFALMNSQPIRIMWARRGMDKPLSGTGNVLIKNLDKCVNSKGVYDAFSSFGSIESWKMAQDEEGNCLGYGFIRYLNDDCAQEAVKKANGMVLEGNAIVVENADLDETTFPLANVYVKNFAKQLNQKQLEKMFEKFGGITSCVVMTDDDGKSKGFGFVAFERPEDADRVIAEMNGFAIAAKRKLYVCRAQTKHERQMELKRHYENRVLVTNLDESIDDDALREAFEGHGNIDSVEVKRDTYGLSKGCAIICFEKVDDAAKAVLEMNNKMVGSMAIHVAFVERKEYRKAQPVSQNMQHPAPNPGYFVSSGIPVGNLRPTFMPIAPIQNAPMRPGAPQWNAVSPTAGFGPSPSYNASQQLFSTTAPPLKQEENLVNYSDEPITKFTRPGNMGYPPLPCPNSKCDQSLFRRWKCNRCGAVLRYGFDDHLYCECGKLQLKHLSFKCSQHGNYVKYDEQVLLKKIRRTRMEKNL